jgi:hypothetical protein
MSVIRHRIAQLGKKWFIQHPFADEWGWDHQANGFTSTARPFPGITFDTEAEARAYAEEYLPSTKQPGGYHSRYWGPK